MPKTVLPLFLAALLCAPGAALAQAKALNPTRAEVDALTSADRDGDRHLDAEEFRVFVQAMAQAGQPTAKRIRFFGAYGMAFGIVDADKDGRLTPAELRAADDDYRRKGG